MPDDTTPYDVTTDLDRIDLDVVHLWLSTAAYWALGRSRETVETAARNSVDVGVLDGSGALCAYARVVLSTFDAHGVYEQVGFTALPEPGRWMIRTPAP